MSNTSVIRSGPATSRGTIARRRTARWLSRAVWRLVIFALFLFLLAPVLVVAVMSLDTQSYLGFPPKGLTLEWYSKLWENEAFLKGFQVSFIVGLATCLLATLIGVPASLGLARHRFRAQGAVSSLFLAPLLVPTVVLGLALLLVLSPIGLTGSYPGLVLAHLAITTPYVIRTTTIALTSQDLSCEEAAHVLGANGWTTFRRVTLPLAAPGILAGAAIAFLISFDEAVIALFVVGPNATTLPVEIYRYVQFRTDPQIAALSVVLIAISLVFVVVIERVVGLKRALR